MITNTFTSTYVVFLALISFILQTACALEEIDNYILYFDEWRFDWDHLNDFDNDYHESWTDIINNNAENNDKTYGCTHNLQTINKKLCVLQTSNGDFIFKFKDGNNNAGINGFNRHSNMISSAKQLSNYYNNIELRFDNDNYWSSIKSIDGINGYEAIKKCQPFTFMELCAIYNPYTDNLNIHTKIANFKKRKNTNNKILKISNANINYDNVYTDDDELSIEDAMAFAMQDYDDTLRYWHWRGNKLGYDKFDEHSTNTNNNNNNNNNNNDNTFGGHTYYFNELSFNWDDSRDWISFSKQTDIIEEVGGHPDKLEDEVGAHPKQADTKDTESQSKSSKTNEPSRSYTKCTGAIPFIHKHACVTIGTHNTHVQLTSAKKEEINILYNGLDDILNEIDNDNNNNNNIDNTQNKNQYSQQINNPVAAKINDDIYDEEYMYNNRRLYETNQDTKFVFSRDNDWDEIITSYGFDNPNENNFGRFGSKRVNENNMIKTSQAIDNVMKALNLKLFRPKLVHKSLPFLFPSIKKCVNSNIVKLCLNFDVHQKAVKLDIHLPRVAPFFKCIKNPKECNDNKLKRLLRTGKSIFNGVKRGMGLIRQIGRRNRYSKKRKHLKKALKQIGKIRNNLRHLTRQIQKSIGASANDIDENRYSDEEDDTMAQKIYDVGDERGLLLYANIGTNDFNDIWDDDNEWNAIEDMTTWNGKSITRKCLTIWKKKLCLCQFLGWLDGPEKYHCLFPHHETFDNYNEYNPNTNTYHNIHVKQLNPKIIVHHFHHVYGAHTIDNNNILQLPNNKPNWMPLWMWQDTQNQHQNLQISNILYSAHQDEYDDIINLNEAYDNYEEREEEEEEEINEENNLREDAWIEMSESATHSFDTEWDNDKHWDEINEIKTWEGTSIRRKCLHLWKHRLCLCQFLGWMDTNKYQCIYHKRLWNPMNVNVEHVYDDKQSPNIVFHNNMPIHGRTRRKRKIRWHINNPLVIHHFHHFHHVPNTIQHHIYHQQQQQHQHQHQDQDTINSISLKKREKLLHARERREKEKERKFSKLLWKDRHNHQMWKIMKTGKPVIGKTATGRHMIVAQHINPHGEPIMVSMHKHMPNDRPQWMPQGLFTNLKHRGYYMVHPHQKGDHSTITKDEQRYPHGSDFTNGASAKIQTYDLYDMYYYTNENNNQYDDEYYYNSQYDKLFDANKIYDKYNDEKYENQQFSITKKFIDEFMDNFQNEWVISDLLNSFENSFYNLININENKNQYWDNLQELETKKGELVSKKCVNIFNTMSCLCDYNNKHYHCHKKTGNRYKYYLDTRMPKDTPQWMSAHDFEWLKDQRLSAFTELLPDPLMKHMEYNQLFNIPFNALSNLVNPAVKMEHIIWHKDEDNDYKISSAKIIDEDNDYNYYNDYYNNYYYDDEYVNEYVNGYVNEYGDYIIDEFYNELDGTKWVVTNEWTNDLNDIWKNNDKQMDDIQIFSAAANTNGANTNTNTNTNTVINNQNAHRDAEVTLSSRCMEVFGRNVCLCEFVNWVYDHSGNNPLYKCYSSASQASNNGNNANNANMEQHTPHQQLPQHNTQVIKQLTSLQEQVVQTRKKIDQLLSNNKNGYDMDTKASATSATSANSEMNTKASATSATSHTGWGSKMVDYGYDKYNEYDNNYNNEYQNDDDDDDDDVDDVDDVDDTYGYYNGYDLHNNYDIESDETTKDRIQPNWWTEGEGFTQTLYIGVNIFWGLILLSVFFGMLVCSLVCAFLHFKKLFCKNGKFQLYGNYNYNQYDVNKINEYLSDGLHTIHEHENVKFNVDNNTDSGQEQY